MWLPRFPRGEAAEPPAPAPAAHALPLAAVRPQHRRRLFPTSHVRDDVRYNPYPVYCTERTERKLHFRAMSGASPSAESPAPTLPEEISDTKPSAPPKERRFKLSRYGSIRYYFTSDADGLS